MAFPIPSIGDVSARIRAAFTTEIPGADAVIWPNNLYVVAKAIALGTREYLQRVGWLYDQIFASTATGTHLDRHAYEVGLSRKAATYASGYVSVTGVPGQVVPAGRRFVRTSDGRSFATTANVTIPASGAVTLSVRAVDTGAIPRTAAGTVLARESTYPELTSDGTVTSEGVIGGAAAESDEDLRARVLYRKRNPPHGGALHDYIMWATSVVGVRKAYAAAYSNGGRMVQVYVLQQGRDADQIPPGAVIDAVTDYIAGEAPVTATFTVTAPTAKVIPITIRSLSPNSSAVRDEVVRELSDMFNDRSFVALPGDASSFPRSWIEAAVDAAAGEDRHVLVTPSEDVTLQPGEFPVLGSVGFV